MNIEIFGHSYEVTLSGPLFVMLGLVLEKSREILLAPTMNEDLLWTVAPILVSLVIFQVYFGLYKDETLGWNSALSNGLVLVWTGSNSLRYLAESGGLWIDQEKTIVGLVLLCYGFLVAVLAFFHLVEPEFLFTISSTFVVSYLQYLGVLFVFGNIEIDRLTIYSCVFLFVALKILFSIIKWLEPERFSPY